MTTNEHKEEHPKTPEPILFECPHCQEPVLVERDQVNCAIFRHGVFKTTGQQMDPHAPKAHCDQVAAEGAIWGCGKPFRLVLDTKAKDGTFSAQICEYL